MASKGLKELLPHSVLRLVTEALRMCTVQCYYFRVLSRNFCLGRGGGRRLKARV